MTKIYENARSPGKHLYNLEGAQVFLDRNFFLPDNIKIKISEQQITQLPKLSTVYETYIHTKIMRMLLLLIKKDTPFIQACLVLMVYITFVSAHVLISF